MAATESAKKHRTPAKARLVKTAARAATAVISAPVVSSDKKQKKVPTEVHVHASDDEEWSEVEDFEGEGDDNEEEEVITEASGEGEEEEEGLDDSEDRPADGKITAGLSKGMHPLPPALRQSPFHSPLSVEQMHDAHPRWLRPA